MPEDKEVKTRVLTKVIDGIAGIIAPDYGVIMGGGEGWKHLHIPVATGFDLIYNIQTIDLSGYTRQDMTLFPQGILMQDMQTLPQGITCFNLQRATMVSTTPINESDLINIDIDQGNTWHLPGSNSSTHELHNILQGRLQNYSTLTTFTTLQQTSEVTWGSGDSTAAEKIWLCDAVLVHHVEGSQFASPDQAFVLPSIIAHEPELEYLMRLMRSVEPVY